MTSKPSKERLPFEPKQTKKKSSAKPAFVKPSPVKNRRADQNDPSLSAIPDAVSKRMIRRMALFSGLPTALGVCSFVGAYYVVSHEILDLPPIAVLLVSLGCFGLGVVGLSYGILSTSWDENQVGSMLGLDEFGLNFGRMVQAWKANRKDSRS